MYCVDVNRSTTSERSTVRGAPARRARTCYDMMFQHHESDHGVARGGAQDPLVDSRWSTVRSCRRSSSRSSAACQPAAHAAPIMSRAGSCRSTPAPSPPGPRSAEQPPPPDGRDYVPPAVEREAEAVRREAEAMRREAEEKGRAAAQLRPLVLLGLRCGERVLRRPILGSPVRSPLIGRHRETRARCWP